jgi:hypothetical protein
MTDAQIIDEGLNIDDVIKNPKIYLPRQSKDIEEDPDRYRQIVETLEPFFIYILEIVSNLHFH